MPGDGGGYEWALELPKASVSRLQHTITTTDSGAYAFNTLVHFFVSVGFSTVISVSTCTSSMWPTSEPLNYLTQAFSYLSMYIPGHGDYILMSSRWPDSGSTLNHHHREGPARCFLMIDRFFVQELNTKMQQATKNCPPTSHRHTNTHKYMQKSMPQDIW